MLAAFQAETALYGVSAVIATEESRSARSLTRTNGRLVFLPLRSQADHTTWAHWQSQKGVSGSPRFHASIISGSTISSRVVLVVR